LPSISSRTYFNCFVLFGDWFAGWSVFYAFVSGTFDGVSQWTEGRSGGARAIAPSRSVRKLARHLTNACGRSQRGVTRLLRRSGARALDRRRRRRPLDANTSGRFLE
jgi:hypothetical protein